MDQNAYLTGIRRGLPVGVGYFSVAFGFGAMTAAEGIRALDATLISLTNFTSAGQFAGVTLILAGTGLWEVILTQIVINSRYALMGLALSQRLGKEIGLLPRLFISFIDSDEIFALAMAEPGRLSPSFMAGLGLAPVLGWVGGTLCGALAGSVLPLAVRTALGVMLYGMFVAIVVPPAKKDKPVLAVVLLALVLSCLLAWVPALREISPGIAIVLCTVVAAGLGAWLFPVPDEEVAA